MLQHVGKSALWVDFFVGEALMRELIDWAKRTPRVRKIELLMRATNQGAVRLYSKFGFFEEGRFKDRVRLPHGKFVDDIAMGWFPEQSNE